MQGENDILVQAARDILFPNGDLTHTAGPNELEELQALFHPELKTRLPQEVRETMQMALREAKTQSMLDEFRRSFPALADYLGKKGS